MIAPQGFFWWPGIDSFLHGSFSFTHGITPSLATLYIAPQLAWPEMVGELTVNYQPGGQSYTFDECLLDFISIERGPDGRQVWGLHILDRRWKWKDCGKISGCYNIRRTNGDGDSEVFTPSIRTVQELMTLCLNAMGEDEYGFDVSGVDEQTYPETEWDYDNPAQALLDLCDKYGYRVILTLENQVLIAKANFGNYLPQGTYMAGATTTNPPNTPSAIVVVAGKTVAQYDFPIVPMAMELDNTVVPLDLVSYAPQTPHGWGDVDIPDFDGIEDPIAREYAKKSVFKYFQVGLPVEMPGLDPLNPENDQIDDVTRILPLLDTQITKSPKVMQPHSEDSEEPVYMPGHPLPAWVYGIWATYEDESQNATNEIDSSISTPDLTKGWYPHSFQIDGERGLVIFDDHVFSFPDTDSNGSIPSGQNYKIPPTLYLRTSCNVRDAETMGFIRDETRQDLTDAQTFTLPKYVKTEDVARKITYTFTGFGELDDYTDNLLDVLNQAKYVAKSTLQKMLLDDPQSFEYIGLVFIDMDGAIQQLTWTVDANGQATTQANRNKEDLVNTPSYAEQKQAALLQMALANKDKMGRIIKQDLSQSLTVSGLGGLVSK